MATIARETHVDRLHFLIETQHLINAGVADSDHVMSVRSSTGLRPSPAQTARPSNWLMATRWSALSRVGLAESSKDLLVASDRNLSGQCRRLAIPLICRDTETDSRVDREACRLVGARSIAVAPIVHGGQGVGVLKVLSGEPDHFDDAAGDVLELLAGFIATSLSTMLVTFRVRRERALQDPLTGLPTRMLLIDRLQHGRLRRTPLRTALSACSSFRPDHFDAVSTGLGYECGEAVLRAISTGLNPPSAPATRWPVSRTTTSRSSHQRRPSRRRGADPKPRRHCPRLRDQETVWPSRASSSPPPSASSGVRDDASAESLLTSASTAAYRAKRQRSRPPRLLSGHRQASHLVAGDPCGRMGQ